MVHHQRPEAPGRDNAAVGRSQDAERGKKTRKFKCPSSSSCFLLVFKCPGAVCDGAEPDRGADSGQEPVQKCGECEAGHLRGQEPPEAAGQLGEGGREDGGEEPQAETPLLLRPPAAGGLRPGMCCVLCSVIITRLTNSGQRNRESS